jgi:hypothetical protein
MCQHVKYIQEITILTPCLLTEFHSFSVYSLQEPGLEYWSFSRVKWGIIYQVPKDVTPRASTGPKEGMGQDQGPMGLLGGRPTPLFHGMS